MHAAAGNRSCMVVVDVGGHVFKTTEETLCSVKGSRLCHMLGQAESQVAGTKNLFIDRNGKVSAHVCCSRLPLLVMRSATKAICVQAFAFILEYLRSFSASDADFALPPAHMVAAVLAEALYFRLPGGIGAGSSQVQQSRNCHLTDFALLQYRVWG